VCFIKTAAKKYTDSFFSKKQPLLLILMICVFLFILLASPVLALSSISLSSNFIVLGQEDYPADAIVSDRYALLQENDVCLFEEGYEVYLKGVGSNNVWIEYQNNISSVPRFVGDVILKEGDTIQCYRQSETGRYLIMTMTLDKIFINNSDVIIGFSDICQYRDPDFSNFSDDVSWVIEVNKPIQDNRNTPQDPGNNNDSRLDPDLISQPIYVIAAVFIIFIAAVLISFFFRKKTHDGESKK